MDDTTESPSTGAASETQDGEASSAGRSASALSAGLAGLQAGMLGALGMLTWLGIVSIWDRRGFWHDENLFATFFYGDDAVRAGFGVKTLPGLALYLIVYSALGFIFAVALRNHVPPRRLLLTALIFASGWFYLSFHLLWKSVMPLVYLLYADRPMIVGHLIYGACLARFPGYLPGKKRGPGSGSAEALPALPSETGPLEHPEPVPRATAEINSPETISHGTLEVEQPGSLTSATEIENGVPTAPAALETERSKPLPPSALE
jgi:hypothetical protein